ncbi:zinc ribbon domain-containing protein [Dissulfurirhabdus thermomarina]|uniref:Zinc ribbon domain-containing protein n=1 Tax=Dissulfurirhabdus thermomarina TaxID=1765737 RepID=A0A6N9TM56_DISTH|nr:zinc ribbon domain-containing protein [Dissulfurirhabdus thermomarina]NDY42325.1 zinc ribbon domain-containing protein [Dissulfurirhabdus thermomarina]NMX23392.1 zinc ribbon domain-containing protein [Dissulfurirhabdus thermomarina]
MPLYEFTCRSCGHEFELLLMNRDEMEAARCPICQSPDVGKLMSAANVAVGEGRRPGAGRPGPTVQHRRCGGGSCTSVELPGHKK